MNKQLYVVLGFVLMLIIIYVQIGEIKTATNGSFDSVHQNIQSLHEEISMLQQEVNDLKAKQEWVNAEEFKANDNKSTQKKLFIDLHWSFKEIEKDAIINVNYRKRNSDWIKAEAVNTGGTSYKVTFALEPDEKYEYQIFSEGELSRADAIKNIPLEMYHLTPLFPEISELQMDEKGYILFADLEIIQHEKPAFDFLEAKDVYLHLHSKNKSEKVELKGANETSNEKSIELGQRVWTYRADLASKNINMIELEVNYQNGCVQREIIEGFFEEEQKEIFEEPKEKDVDCY